MLSSVETERVCRLLVRLALCVQRQERATLLASPKGKGTPSSGVSPRRTIRSSKLPAQPHRRTPSSS
jgi:hypothetical protein